MINYYKIMYACQVSTEKGHTVTYSITHCYTVTLVTKCNTPCYITLHFITFPSKLNTLPFKYTCVIIFKGKVAFGNKMVETTLCFHFESAAAIYRVTKVREHNAVQSLNDIKPGLLNLSISFTK